MQKDNIKENKSAETLMFILSIILITLSVLIFKNAKAEEIQNINETITPPVEKKPIIITDPKKKEELEKRYKKMEIDDNIKEQAIRRNYAHEKISILNNL